MNQRSFGRSWAILALLGAAVGPAAAQPGANAGVASLATPIPANPSLEGTSADCQTAAFAPGGGGYLGAYNLSNGLRVRIGSSIANCQ